MWKWFAFLLFSAFVALEAWLLLAVGGALGVGWTLLWLLGSSLAGLLMVRVGGLAAVLRIHRRLREQELPTRELGDMALVLLGGVLLILPGLLSDAMGLALLLRPVRWGVRSVVWALYGPVVPPAGAGPPRRSPPSDEVIEIRPIE
jgi:UPF0716 protein FxsA